MATATTVTDPDELRQALLAIAAAFDSLGTGWAIGGSLASATYGEPRATNDVDVIAVLDVNAARAFTKLLGSDFYADGDAAAEAAGKRSSFNVIDQRGFIKIDVFVPGRGPLGAAQLDRLRKLDLLSVGHELPVLGPEDVVLQKLNWYKLGGEVSDRQWRDVLSVLRASADLDNAYLDSVAAASELSELLDRARRDV